MRALLKIGLGPLIALAVASCAPIDAETPAQRLFAAQSEFNIYQRVVIVYLSQPECGGAMVIGCAEPQVKAKLKSMAVRIKTALALAKASLETARASDSVAMAAGLVRDLAAYLAQKEIQIEPPNLSADPSSDRSDRARHLIGARDHGALSRHQRQDSHHGGGKPRSDAGRMG